MSEEWPILTDEEHLLLELMMLDYQGEFPLEDAHEKLIEKILEPYWNRIAKNRHKE